MPATPLAASITTWRAATRDVDERVQVAHVVWIQVLAGAAVGPSRQLPDGERAPHELGHALLAGERQGALADQLHPVVRGRVVRRGHHRAAVEAAVGHAVIEHLGGDHPEVDDGGARRGRAGGEGRGDPGRRSPRVPADAQTLAVQLLRQGVADALRRRFIELPKDRAHGCRRP